MDIPEENGYLCASDFFCLCNALDLVQPVLFQVATLAHTFSIEAEVLVDASDWFGRFTAESVIAVLAVTFGVMFKVSVLALSNLNNLCSFVFLNYRHVFIAVAG